MGAFTARLHPALPVPRPLLRLRSDAALGERFAAGDEDAFAVLYERHQATVLAVCMGVLGARHDAEDALQDCFAALASALRVRPPRELRPWLIRVARNAAIDIARRRRSAEYAGDEVLERAAPPDGASGELQIVLVGIRELPENQRTALLMRELAGHSYREIADYLETEEDAVRGLIARARIGLRDHRAATELPCEHARQALAIEPHHRAHDRTVRRHVRSCAGCQAYARMLRDDAKALRGLAPLSTGAVAAGGVIAGGLGAKGALLGGALSQAGAACAVSVCAVGGIALIAPRLPVIGATPTAATPHSRAASARTSVTRGSTLRATSHPSGAGTTVGIGVNPAGVGSASEQRRLSGAGTVVGGVTIATVGAGASAGRYDRTRGATAPSSPGGTQSSSAPPGRDGVQSGSGGATRGGSGAQGGGSGAQGGGSAQGGSGAEGGSAHGGGGAQRGGGAPGAGGADAGAQSGYAHHQTSFSDPGSGGASSSQTGGTMRTGTAPTVGTRTAGATTGAGPGRRALTSGR